MYYYREKNNDDGAVVMGWVIAIGLLVCTLGLFLAWLLIKWTVKLSIKYFKWANRDPKWLAETKFQYYGYQ